MLVLSNNLLLPRKSRLLRSWSMKDVSPTYGSNSGYTFLSISVTVSHRVWSEGPFLQCPRLRIGFPRSPPLGNRPLGNCPLTIPQLNEMSKLRNFVSVAISV